jgi:MoxR-like ATPase
MTTTDNSADVLPSSVHHAFAAFRAEPSLRVAVALRRYRAGQIAAFLASPDALDPDRFDRAVWRLQGVATFPDGTTLPLPIDGSRSLSAVEIVALESAMAAGTLQMTGNDTFGSGTRIFAPSVAAERRAALLAEIQAAVASPDLSGPDLARRLMTITGIGENAGTGIAMLLRPTEVALMNAVSRPTLARWGLAVGTFDAFQAAAARTRDLLGAADFIELDLFLYRYQEDFPVRYWWINQGDSYDIERDNGVIWASVRTPPLEHHRRLEDMRPGDRLVHYSRGAIRALGTVTDAARRGPHPKAGYSDAPGNLVAVAYAPNAVPVDRGELPTEVRVGGPFNVEGRVNQGYAYPLTPEQWDAIEHVVATVGRRRHWVFQASPAVFDLPAFLAAASERPTDDWKVSKHWKDMHRGDRVAFWVAGPKGGMTALGELISEPFKAAQPVDPDDPRGDGWRVRVRYDTRIESPIDAAKAKADEILASLPMFAFPAGTNFPITGAHWQRIVELTLQQQPPTIDAVAAATHLPLADLEEMLAMLETKRQIILEGPPGAGKTFVAQHLARYVAGGDDRVTLVQFHPSYSYEDFVQGIRPRTDGGALTYAVEDGLFTRLCRRAAADPGHRYVLLVDEINRGNLAKIFGELLLLLEYRDLEADLPHGGRLRIPANLAIIGTMNSTDRSLAMVDYALRRRFYFFRMQPVVAGEAPVLARWLATQADEPAVDLAALLVAINRRLALAGLPVDFQVGHSYLMSADALTREGLARIWRRAIQPLLEEYVQGYAGSGSGLADMRLEDLLADLASAGSASE